MTTDKTPLDEVLEAAENAASFSYTWDDLEDDKMRALHDLKQALFRFEAAEPELWGASTPGGEVMHAKEYEDREDVERLLGSLDKGHDLEPVALYAGRKR